MASLLPNFEPGPFRRFVDGLRDSVAIDEQGVLTYVNPKFLEHLGLLSETSALGRSMTDLLERELFTSELAQLTSAIDSARARAEGAVTELRLAFSRAGERVYEVSIHTQQPPSGTVLVFTLKEVMTAHGVRAALEHTDRLASLGTLAAGVAHEINNPLAYVVSNLGYSIEQIIRIRGQLASAPLPERLSEEFAHNLTLICEALEEAGEGTDRVARIVQGLKSFSRSEGESRGPVNLEEVLNSAVNMAENEIRYRAQLERAFGETPIVFGNEARLVQVFVNLLVNAAQAVGEGEAQTNEIRIVTLTDPSGNAVVEIRDTGPGIPEAVLGRVFDPFFTTKPVGVGTGLGLAICHGIVSSMGGRITAGNREGGGAVFRVTLPPASEPGAAHGAPRPTHAQAARAAVLVVDDEPAVGVIMTRVLRGYEVTSVTTAKAALALIDSGAAFDVILSDVMMPEMSGMELYSELLARNTRWAERMVFVTGGAFTPAAKAFLDSVANERIDKPFNPAVVRALVERFVK